MDRQSPSARLRGLANWLARETVDIFAALTGFYYSKKFAVLTGRRSRPPAGERPTARGFVAVEIDGLSHHHLRQAIDDGHMPYLASQLRNGHLELSRWRCGLPSTTPAAQAGILFGNNYDIPGFRWYEKDTGLSVVPKLPGFSKLLQDRVTGAQPGILRGGSSYFNMFDGDAAVSLFTLGALNRQRVFEAGRGLGSFLLFVLNPVRTAKLLLLSIWEYASDVVQRVSGRLRGERRLPFQGIFPLLRVSANVLFREVQTFALLMDIYRGVPAIYTTYYGYDEMAHHYGADSGPARHALRELDKRLRQIDRLRRARLSRDYDLLVLADHGQTTSEPFSQRYGQTLGQYIRRCLGGGLILQEHAGDEQHSVFQARYLLQELQGIEGQMAEPLAIIARRVRGLVSERTAIGEEENPPLDLGRKSDVIVRNSGSLAHVYFNVSGARLQVSEISALFPDLVLTLASHPGIWLVVGVEGDDVLLFSREGVLTLHGDEVASAEGTNPLAHMPEPGQALHELATVARYPHSGDLILLGRYDPESDTVVCFEDQWASHGGLGGPQDYPFLLHPPELGWDLSGVCNARELYAFFAETYLNQPAPAPAGASEPAGPVEPETAP